ncbi:MAG: Glu-tRNA(Gln) amidotransferase subunit GatD [archaeon]|nr:Glu-tRNA(Gln) amidotransferase subunit GatD [archaeon]
MVMSYSTKLSKKLETLGAEDGCKLSIEANGKTHIGTMIHHHKFSAPDIVILKLKNGYNIGIRITDHTVIKMLEKPVIKYKTDTAMEENKSLPTLVFIGTGGTIASHVDHRTGAVHPTFPISDIVRAVPEIKNLTNIRTKMLFSILSENMDISHWQKLAEAVAEEINDGADGIIILHGTDTMSYTAAALSFMLPNISKPVVLVGSQKSFDRPSSDAFTNIIACVRFCIQSKKAGVYVIMHDTPNDDSFAVHLGSRVRKTHTSKRSAFESINTTPAAHLDGNGKITFNMKLPECMNRKIKAYTDMERSTVFLQCYPGMNPELFRDVIMKSKGVVIAGTGLGHTNENMVPLITDAIKNGTVIVMTSQCINGQTNMNIYSTGRDLTNAGVISVLDMLPETAYVKLSWALANCKDINDVKRTMKTPLVNEMSERRVF